MKPLLHHVLARLRPADARPVVRAGNDSRLARRGLEPAVGPGARRALLFGLGEAGAAVRAEEEVHALRLLRAQLLARRRGGYAVDLRDVGRVGDGTADVEAARRDRGVGQVDFALAVHGGGVHEGEEGGDVAGLALLEDVRVDGKALVCARSRLA